MIKLSFLLLFCFYYPFSLFAQKDSTKIDPLSEEIAKSYKIIDILKNDAETAEQAKNKNSLAALNMASPATMGFFPSELVASYTIINDRKYIWRLYIDVKYQSPFVLFVELEQGTDFIISKSESQQVEANKEIFFSKIMTFLQDEDTPKDINIEMEKLMQETILKCEKYKNCEECWILTDCN